MKSSQMRRIALLIACACFAVSPVMSAAGWTTFGYISEFNQNPPITPGNEALFFRSSADSNPSGCSVGDGYYLQISTDLQKRLFALLTAAKLSDKRVRLYVTSNCHTWGYAEVSGLTIE